MSVKYAGETKENIVSYIYTGMKYCEMYFYVGYYCVAVDFYKKRMFIRKK